MTIWLLALLLLAALASLGYTQGAIRTGFSVVGVLFGILLGGLLGGVMRPILGILGMKNPVLAWMVGPLIIYLIIVIGFTIAGFTVHQKVDVYYKYKAGDLRLALWERINRRLGLCLGLLHGAMYLILISFVIYNISYWTTQMATGDTDSRMVRLANKMGADLQSSGFIKVARAVDPMKESWYQAADLAGILYNNPLLEARLARYPAFLGLAETQEFQDVGSDIQFTEMRQRRDPLKSLMDHPKAQAILQNPVLLRTIWETVQPNLTDLPKYLETGRSPKYGAEPILGRWDFDVNAGLGIYLRAHPNIASSEMQKTKKWLVMGFSKTTLTAKVDHHVTLKNAPQLQGLAAGATPAPGNQTLEGEWKSLDGGKYLITLSGSDLNGTVEASRLSVTGTGGINLVFSRED